MEEEIEIEDVEKMHTVITELEISKCKEKMCPDKYYIINYIHPIFQLFL